MDHATTFAPAGFEQDIVLYHGPARLHAGDGNVDGIGQLRFDWRRTPGVRWDFASDEVPHDVVGDDRHVAKRFEPLDLGGDLMPPAGASRWTRETGEDLRYRDDGRQPRDSVIGRSDGFASLQVMVLNYVDQVWKERPSLDVEASGWHITVERRADTTDTLNALQQRGGFGCTHMARVTRIGGESFGFSDAEPVLDALWYLTSFAAGGLVGLALPVGSDAHGRVVGYESRDWHVDPYRGRLSWLDDFHVEVVGGLFEGWFSRVDDPFWGATLPRAIRQCVSANQADPLDVAIVTALSCLELLAWAALQVDLGWLDPRDGQLNLTGRLRLLLRWSGIDPAVPEQLEALRALAASDSNIPDGPAAIAWVRNRSVHPPKLSKSGKPGWPSWDQLHEAWRLALEYTDLVILRLLGHSGDFGSRLHMEGRWVGTVTRVPWATDAAPMELSAESADR